MNIKFIAGLIVGIVITSIAIGYFVYDEYRKAEANEIPEDVMQGLNNIMDAYDCVHQYKVEAKWVANGTRIGCDFSKPIPIEEQSCYGSDDFQICEQNKAILKELKKQNELTQLQNKSNVNEVTKP